MLEGFDQYNRKTDLKAVEKKRHLDLWAQKCVHTQKKIVVDVATSKQGSGYNGDDQHDTIK